MLCMILWIFQNPISIWDILNNESTYEILDASEGIPSIYYSDVQGGASGDNPGNILENPQFGSLANNGGSTKTMSLNASSPCLGAGTATGAPTNSQNNFPNSSPPNMGSWAGPSGTNSGFFF